MFTNKYVIAIAIPLALLLAGAVLRKIVRGDGWKREDFFLGVELALSALGTAMVYVYDLTQPAAAGLMDAATSERMIATTVFMIICLCLLFVVISIHQDWQKRPHNRKGQIVWLGFVCNGVGVSLLLSFILLVKGV